MPLPLFNKNLDVKLLKLVKENPILYNTGHSNYLNFDAREVVWQKIGDTLNRPALACKSRWVNMRDMMRRKFRTRHMTPANAKRQYKYKYEEEMSFMIPFFKEAASNSEDYSEFYQEDGESEVGMSTEIFVDTNADFEETKPTITFKKRLEEPPTREFTETVYQELNPTDPLDVFLLTIGSTLRKFSPYFLNQAKSKIFQVVQDYELQQIVHKDDHSGSSADTNNTNR